MQPVQDNPLQPVQSKPLNTGSGFEPYKPQKSAFGLGNSGGFGNRFKAPDFQSAQQINNARLQNYYNRPFASYIPWGEVGQAAKDGITSGLEQVLNGATLGAYNYLDRHSDNAAAERYNRLQNDAYQAGIGNWYDRVQDANTKIGMSLLKKALRR